MGKGRLSMLGKYQADRAQMNSMQKNRFITVTGSSLLLTGRLLDAGVSFLCAGMV